MGLKLYINGQSLDLYPDEGITLKRKIIGATGIDSPNSSFTKDFNIPASPINNYLLSHYELKSNTSTINPHDSLDAIIDIDGTLHFKGTLEVMSVTWKLNKPESYKVVFYSNVANIKTKLGSKLLSDITQINTDFGFTWTADTIAGDGNNSVIDSWAGNVASGNVVIPIMSWKRWYRWYDTGVGNADDIGAEATGVLTNELRVALNLMQLVKSIGEEVGLTFTFSNDLITYFTNSYIIPSKKIEEIDTDSAFETDVEGTGIDVLSDEATICTMPTVTSDPHSRWSADTIYTAEFDGDYQFRFTLLSISGEKRTIDIWDIGAGGSIANTVANGYSPDVYMNVTLAKNATYRFEIELLLPSGTPHQVEMRFRTTVVPVNIFGSTFIPTENMPIMKAADFLDGFLKAFYLVIDETSDDAYTISDTIDFIANGSTLDLGNFINQETITYNKREVYDVIKFKHKESKDAPNDLFTRAAGRQYGELQYRPDIDYSNGTLDKKSIFTIFPPSYLDSYDGTAAPTDLRHHFHLSNESPVKEVVSDFLLFYTNGVVTPVAEFFLQESIDANGDPTYYNYQQYLQYSQVQDFNSLSGSNTLSYKEESVFSGVTATGTVVNNYWLDWLTEMYKNTSYSVSVTFPVSLGTYIKIKAMASIYFNGVKHVIADYSYSTTKGSMTLNLIRYDEHTVSTGDYLLADYNNDYST